MLSFTIAQPSRPYHPIHLEDLDRKPNPAYFSAPQLWPVYKNYFNRQGGFDNAYFEIEYGEGGEPSETEDAGSSDAGATDS